MGFSITAGKVRGIGLLFPVFAEATSGSADFRRYVPGLNYWIRLHQSGVTPISPATHRMSVELSDYRTANPKHQSRDHHAQPMVWLAISVATGVTADRFGGEWFDAFGVVSWWLFATIMLAVAAALYFARCTRLSAIVMLIGAGCLGGAWHDLHWNYLRFDELARYAKEVAEPVCFEAIAEKPSQWSPAPSATPLRAIPAEPRSEVEITITRLRNGSEWQDASGDVRLRVNGVLPDINPGDRLLVFGRLSKSTPALNPGQYDYAAADRAAGRHCEVFTQNPACVAVIDPASPFNPNTWLAAGGRWCQRQLARYVGFQQQPISQALLLGVRGELNDETMDAYMKTGTIHLLVVSGMHVALIAALVFALTSLTPLTQNMRLILTIALVIGYSTIVGWQPSVVRSTVLVVMMLVALSRFRQATTANCLAASAILVVAINPSELFRAGTQLSFLGVAAVVVAARWHFLNSQNDPIERMMASYFTSKQHLLAWLKQNFLQTLVASLAVLIVITPLVLFHFNIVSPSAFVLTPLAWIPMAIALISGLAICSFGFLFPPIAWLLGQLCGMCLVVSNFLIENAVHVPGSYFYSAGPALWWVLGFYGAMGIMAIVPGWQLTYKLQAALAMFWITFGLASSAWQHHPTEKLKCTMLAVGHGTCVVLELPSGETVLYDAGSLGSPQGTTNIVSSFLWSRGIKHIDAIVISHADVDHYNGIPGLLERFSVGKIFISPLMFDPWANQGELTAPNYLKEKIDAAGVPLEEVWMNDRLTVGDTQVTLEVLHPPQFGVPGRDNANSILLNIEYAGYRILLPGDLESPGIETVMADAPLDVDVLLAPHHGSNLSDPGGFGAWCTPQWVVLSGRYTADDTRLTTTSYRGVGAEIFHTAESGAVEFTINSAGILCESFR
jgi:competence protein ComEC